MKTTPLMLVGLLPLGLSLAAFAPSVDAAIVTYNIGAATGNPDTITTAGVAGILATSLSKGNNLGADTSFDTTASLFGANSWPTGSSPLNNYFLQFETSPDTGAGYTAITYTSLAYGLFRELNVSTTFEGPATWQLQYSLDGFSSAGTTLATSTISDIPLRTQNLLNQINESVDISSIGTQSGAVTFRFYGYNTSGGIGSFGGLGNGTGSTGAGYTWTGTGSDVSLNVTAVPEPHEYAFLAGLGLLGYAVLRRRNRMIEQV